LSDRSRSTDLQIVCRLLTAITYNLVFDRLPLIERTKTGTFDSGDMDEHIFAAALGLNESITLRRVEPFDSAYSHHGLLEYTIVIGAGRRSRDRSSEVSVVLTKPKRTCAINIARFELDELYIVLNTLQRRRLL
jgi:hypothetical protein